jgi:hypothetical protein
VKFNEFNDNGRGILEILERIIFTRAKKQCRYNNDSRLGEIFLVKGFNKSDAKVYCYAFLHALKRDTCIKP